MMQRHIHEPVHMAETSGPSDEIELESGSPLVTVFVKMAYAKSWIWLNWLRMHACYRAHNRST